MICSLSTSVIIDNIQATAAFQTLSAPAGTTPVLAPLLRQQGRGQLKIIIRNAFARVVLSLLHYVTGCNLDGEGPADDPGSQDPADRTDMLLTVELTTPAHARGFSGAAVRRQLEQAVTMLTLHHLTLAAGDDARARAYATLSSTAVNSILTTLTPSHRPFLRS